MSQLEDIQQAVTTLCDADLWRLQEWVSARCEEASEQSTSPAPQVTDTAGNAITVGSAARIPHIPGWLIEDLPSEDVAAIMNVEGKVLRVQEIDAGGYVWFATENDYSDFCVKPSELVVVREAP